MIQIPCSQFTETTHDTVYLARMTVAICVFTRMNYKNRVCRTTHPLETTTPEQQSLHCLIAIDTWQTVDKNREGDNYGHDMYGVEGIALERKTASMLQMSVATSSEGSMRTRKINITTPNMTTSKHKKHGLYQPSNAKTPLPLTHLA